MSGSALNPKTLALIAMLIACSNCALPTPVPQSFTDDDLARLLRDQRCGLITVVSPRMPLSIGNLTNVTQVAAAHGLSLTVLIDPHSAEERDARALNAFVPRGELRKNESRSLGLHGSLLHYPTLHIFIDGRLAPEVIYGAKSVESYESLLSQVLAPIEPSSGASRLNDRSQDSSCAGLERRQQSLARVDARIAHPDPSFDPNALSVSRQWQETGRVEVSRRAKYYFKPLATGDWIAYQAGWSNYLLDLRSGREIEVPGTIDPVPSPDEKLLTVPSLLASAGLGKLLFFRLDDLLAGRPKKDALVFTDDEIPGTYQSVGQRTENGRTIYRVVSESLYLRSGFYFQDYESVETQGRIVELRPQTSSSRRLCPDVPFALPFLSKTGRLFSGVDPITRSTKIFAVDDSGSCTLKVELGYPTGKVDFSFDDQRLTFHISPIDSRSVTEVMTRPKPELRLDAYVYDLETRQLQRLTDCLDANCYYPSFRKNGEIVYMRQEFSDGSYSFVTLEPGASTSH